MCGGVPGGIRTHDPLLRSYETGLFSGHFEAKLLFCAYPYFSFKILFLPRLFKKISAKLVPKFESISAYPPLSLPLCGVGYQ